MFELFEGKLINKYKEKLRSMTSSSDEVSSQTKLSINQEQFQKFISETSNYKQYQLLSITRKEIIHEVL